MPRSLLMSFAVVLCLPVTLLGQTPKTGKLPSPVPATVETSLETAGEHIRQLAFDGDADSYFSSMKNAGSADHFTLVFDKKVTVKSVTVVTGTPKGDDQLDDGVLEISLDGKTFQQAAKFAEGSAEAKLSGKQIVAVRIKPSADLKHPLAIREFTIDSDPKIAIFHYPVEYTVDVTDAPEMKGWTERAARVCERNYDMLCEELKSDKFKPPQIITIRMKKDYDGVAYASENHITGSVAYFKAHPADFGCMIHETCHCVQAYRARTNPGWLVEGIADYVRFYKYEPGKIGALNPQKVHYNDSYRATASFLNFVSVKYDKEAVRKINKMMRDGEYDEAIFEQLTKKSLADLEKEWLAQLPR